MSFLQVILPRIQMFSNQQYEEMTWQRSEHEAFQAYERKDYQTAALGFEALLSVKEDPGILLLLGNSNLMLGKCKRSPGKFCYFN